MDEAITAAAKRNGRLRRRPRQWLRAIGMALMGVAILAVLLSHFDHEARVTDHLASTSVAARYQASFDRYTCLVGLVHHEIPKGALVYPAATGAYAQLLAELLVRWGVVVSSSDAQWTLSLVTSGPCASTGIKAVEQ